MSKVASVGKGDSSGKNNGRMILLVFACYMVFTYNKKCVTYQYARLLQEFNLTQQDAGKISSSQQLTISLVTFIGGILTDFVPSTVLFPAGLLWCGATTLLFPLGTRTSHFAFVWLMNGIGHGLELPTALRLTKQYSTSATFATNWSFVLTAVNFAGVFSPMWSAFLANTFGWRSAIYLSGAITLTTGLIVILHLKPYSLRLAKMGQTISTEKSNNSTATTRDKTTASSKLRFIDLITFPVLWILVTNRFVVGLNRLSVSDWSQMFFTTEKGLDVYSAGLYVTTFEFASVFGKLLSGRINDYCMRRSNCSDEPIRVRLPISMMYHSVSIVCLYAYCNFIQSSTNVFTMILIAAISGIFSSGNIITLSVLSTEIRSNKIGKEREGLLSSFCNLAAKLGALCSGYPFTMIAFWTDWYTSFSAIWILTTVIVFVDFVYYQWNNRFNKKRAKND